MELRLAAGAIDARQAADGLERLLYSWRGDQRERALRERLAALKARTGEWRAALALLRESETLFPDDKAAIHAELADTFAALLRTIRRIVWLHWSWCRWWRRTPTCCRPAPMENSCKLDWPIGSALWTCRNVPDLCLRN